MISDPLPIIININLSLSAVIKKNRFCWFSQAHCIENASQFQIQWGLGDVSGRHN